MYIDMPLEELKKYQGISPRPDDFDEYWETALSELSEVDPCAKLIESSFHAPNAKCYDLWFQGVRGAKIHAKYLRPDKLEKPAPVVFLFHGYYEDCGNWSSRLSYVNAGFCVAALDCRGQGGLSQDTGGTIGNTLLGHIIRGLDSENPQDLTYRHDFLDVVELVNIVSSFEEVDENKMCAFGYSQGGALCTVCAALCPQIRKAAIMYPFLSDFKRVKQMGLSCRAYSELDEYFKYRDPRHLREDETYQKLGYIDVENFASKIKADVLFFTGLKDETVPTSTQFAVYNKIMSKKELYAYPEYGHEDISEAGDIIYQEFLEVIH